MTAPYYTGRRIGTRPRLFYISDAGETEITFILEAVGIEFIAEPDWIACDRRLVQTAKSIIFHATRSHDLTADWAWLMAWELWADSTDGWRLSRDAVELWLAQAVQTPPPIMRQAEPSAN